MPSKANTTTKATEDLFPRGHSRGQPLLRKKRGVKNADNNNTDESVKRQPERARRRKLTEGATVLAVVTRADVNAVCFELPSGARARADPHEVPCEGGAPFFVDAVAAATGQHDAFQPEKDEDVPLYKVLRVGQVVRAAVIPSPPNSGTNHLYLSLKPALINAQLTPAKLRVKGTHVYAAVKSVEDHGYVLDFGPIPTTGFLPFKDAPLSHIQQKKKQIHDVTGELPRNKVGLDVPNDESSEEEESESEGGYLLPGAPIEVVINQSAKSLEKKRKKDGKSGNSVLSSVKCSAKPELVTKVESIMFEGLTFLGLSAGMRVSAKVQSVTDARIVLNLFGLFTVIVDSVHVPIDADGKPKVKAGSSVMVRLISVDPNQKIITASLLPEVVNKFRIPVVPEACKIGVVVKNLEVTRIETKYGLYLKKIKLDNEDEEMDAGEKELFNIPLFAHISRVSEKRIDTLEKHFHLGKKLKLSARIVSVSKFDGVVNVDLRPSVIKRDVLDLNEVQVGKCYNCKVLSHHSSGNISVAIDGDINIRGLIVKDHIADTPISAKMLSRHPNLRSGGTVNCVVLSVQKKRGSAYLSARRSLVSPANPLLLSYEQAAEALGKYQKSKKIANAPVFVGTVAKVFERFVLVAFCNDTKGSIEFKDLGLEKKEVAGSGKKKRKNVKVKSEVERTQEDVAELFPAGQTIRVCVKGVVISRKWLSLSLNLDGTQLGSEKVEKKVDEKKKKGENIPKIEVGEFFNAVVKKVLGGRGLVVGIPKNARPDSHGNIGMGSVALCDIDGDFDVVNTKLSEIRRGQTVRVRIVKVPGENTSKMFSSSMRKPDENGKDALITSEDVPLSVGRKVRGFVHSVSKFGAIVNIGRDVRARIQLSDLSDEYVREPEVEFARGMVVSGKVCEARKGKNYENFVPLTLRSKEREKKAEKADAPKEGDIVECSVRRVERFGAIVKLKSGPTALLHKKEADDDREVKNPHEEWRVGQELTGVVVVSNEKTVKIGLKRSYFEAASVDSEKIEEILEKNAQGDADEPPSKKARTDTEDAIMQSVDEKIMEEVGDDDDGDEEMDESDNERMETEKIDVTSDEEKDDEKDDKDGGGEEEENENDDEPVLNINHSLSGVKEATGPVSSLVEDEDEDDNEEVEETEVKEKEPEKAEEPVVRKRKTGKEKREKKRAKEAAEREIQQKEEALASNAHGPETAEDFERMLLSEPNSSAIWIRYMAFRLSLVQVDQARAVAERALETIDVEKELEKVNVWMAYVNLEANFGCSGADIPTMKAAAVFRVFDRAVKRITDQLDFHLQVAGSLRESDPQIAEEVMKRAMRQFKLAKEVWIAAGAAKFESGDAVGGRKLMERALMSLEKRDHVAVIMKFSQFEYKYGSVEKGRTVFESLIGNYPKRLDVWNVFLDMETGVCRKAEEDSPEREDAVEATRLIFERCSCLELSSKKMKSVFKKWLGFEKSYGDGASHKMVLARAKQYVESKTTVINASGGDEAEQR